ncbi:MAG: hypothetical protein Unbinned3329contig1000_47 [Prokaryotic dsDNA virus sp.]|jgi:hypothetical protein|nr:MAG: hypothetical protein Unbinned3329contig1000_47 [Prokaryotic dsDNA virus sp.]
MSGLIKSPCINVCVLKDKYCVGCGRSIDDITHWSTYTNEQKRKVIEDINGKTGE